MSKITPTSIIHDDDPEAADLADMGKLLGPARMVLDACAEDRPGHQAEAADMAQRIVDLIGHSVTDEPPHALVELDRLRTERAVMAAALDHCLTHFVHLDEANAAIHCAPVKFSPITFRVAEALNFEVGDSSPVQTRARLATVLGHVGQYELDGGR